MIRLSLTILALLVLSFESRAQLNSYFVSFTDKDNTPYSVNAPENFLSQRSIDRRSNQGIAIIEEDLPITPSYVDGVENTGTVSVRYSSKWLNGVIIQSNPVDAEAVKLLPYVLAIEYIAPDNVGGRVAAISKFEEEEVVASDTLAQYEMLGVSEMRNDGFQGEGMYVAVIDGGFSGVDTVRAFKHLFDDNRLLASYDFIDHSSNVYRYSGHGTRVLSTMAASQTAPDYYGIVPNASYVLYVTENVDIEYRIEEYWWLVAVERADSIGVDVINTSLGYADYFQDDAMDYTQEELDGRTAIITIAAQKVADKGMMFITSAGNTGDEPWQKITFPGDVIDGLAVGSLVNTDRISGFSPYGPTQDNRIKPDVMALGSGTYMINQDGSLVSRSGSSYASPQVAGLITGIWQAFPDLTVKELLDAVRLSSTHVSEPGNRMGYGIPSYRAVVNYLEQFSANDWISIYPNPISANDLNVRVTNPSEDNSVQIELFNTLGQPILIGKESITWQNNEYILDVSTLPRGIYVLNLQSSNNFTQLKFSRL